jgi:hypothetical protein
MKYSRDLISYFDPISFNSIEPKQFIDDVSLNAFHRCNRKKQLAEYRRLGFIKKIKIVPRVSMRENQKS